MSSEQCATLLKSEVAKKNMSQTLKIFCKWPKTVVLNVGGGAFDNVWRHF